ncbi:MnmC family methyltransferase [Kiritimatiellaeota bacterium B1221]|nr:MnmC family methyltransferase [Kiritimatiellaeota bacterium B1221]
MTSRVIKTDDGSLTLRHPEVGEAYHSLDGAASETRNKFILPSRLSERLAHGPVRLLDVGFGLGLNCRAALSCPSTHPLHIDSLEREPQALDRGLMLFPGDPLILSLRASGYYQNASHTVELHLGDVRQSIQTLSQPYDLIFHDPFSPVRNSECWTVELFAEMFRLLNPGGALLTYSQSKMVRAAMHEAGFIIRDTPVPAPHRGGTLACKQGTGLDPAPALPLRDPTLNASGHKIRSLREAEIRRAST